MKQLKLIPEKKYKARKVARGISTGSPNHVTLKSRLPLLRRHHVVIRTLIRESQLRYGIRIRTLAIMENHLHLLIEVPTRTAFANFLRVLAGGIALKIGRGKLWLNRAWSRVVRWGSDYRGVVNYINGNPVVAGCFDDTDVFVIRKGVLVHDRP